MPLYRSYLNPVQRADLGRYCLLARLGGVYADIDTEALRRSSRLRATRARCSARSLRAQSPRHLAWDAAAVVQRHDGQPPGPPDLGRGDPPLRAGGRDLDPRRAGIDRASGAERGDRGISGAGASVAQFLSPVRAGHLAGADTGGTRIRLHAALRLSRHNWAGTWFKVWRVRRLRRWKRICGAGRCGARWGRGADPAQVLARLDRDLLARPLPPADPAPQVVCPWCRSGTARRFSTATSRFCARWITPRTASASPYCEGDSRDDSAARIAEIRVRYGAEFAGIEHLTYSAGLTLPREGRWKPKYQRAAARRWPACATR